MTIPRNLSFLAEGASSTGVLGTANGGTGLSTLGTAGQALVVNSGATGLTYSTPSAGAMTLISTQTASSSASLAWTGLSGYDKYLLIVEDILLPAPGSTYLTLSFGYGSSPTYISSYYGEAGWFSNSSAIARNFSNSNQFTNFTGGGSYTTGYVGYHFSTVNISSALNGAGTNATYQSIFYSPASGVANEVTLGSFCYYPGNTPVGLITAIKITPSTSTITSGSASLYGISS